MFANLFAKLFRESSSKALALSGLVHVSGLMLLAQSWFLTTVEVPRLAGSRQAAIQLTASFRETTQQAPVIVPAMTMDVTPSVARGFNRRFVETPSAEIDWNLDAVVIAANSIRDEVEPRTIARAHDSEPHLVAASARQIELPRAEMVRVPTTPIVVPPAAGTNATTPPEYDFVPPPRYPELARQRGWHGTVLLAVKIDATGQVTDVQIDHSSGYQLLDAAAVNAVRRWRYKPAVGSNGPVATEELQPVTFRLPR